MFLSIATTHRPATDIGYLLHKHPERLHQIELTFGKAWVFYPEASPTRCETALVLDVDPIGLVRGKGQAEGLLDQYANDRPYAASSFLSVALNRAFRTAMTGVCNARQELADSAIPWPCHMWTPPFGKGFYERSCKTVGCSHMSGLCARLLWPLALMVSAD